MSLLLRRPTAPEGHIDRVSVRMGVQAEHEGSVSGLRSILTTWFVAVSAGAASLLSRTTWRHMRDILFHAVVVGGPIAVPIAAVVALISLWVPASVPLHWVGGQVFGCAILWFVASLFGAHAQRRRREEGPAR